MLNIPTLKSTYTNEQILVILLTRLYFGTQHSDEIRDFLNKEIVDWKLFYKLITYNDIRSFINEVITDAQITIDQQIHDALKKDTMGIALLGDYQAGLITQLMTAFEKLDIRVIPYKGYTLAKRYYKAPHLRESSDVDLLVNKSDLPLLRKYLYENGYEPKINISEHQIKFILRYFRELSYKSPKNKIGVTCSVELQWKLLDYYYGPCWEYDQFVQNLQSFSAADGTVHVGLTPTYDFLCVASHHLIREPLMKYKYLIDLACIVKSSPGQLDWNEVNLQFEKYKFSALLWSGMNALEDIIGLQLPSNNIPVAAYKLFTATETRSGLEVYSRRRRLSNLNRTFKEKIEFYLKTQLFRLIPNLNDLSRTTLPVWTIPLIIPVKSCRVLYLYVTKKR
ncbi:putative nucleotidyltransferase-like protein [Chitinophaga dinghuensis]|uniref:Putative nucleotidyltransferase-like protein n=1 Tax=Chitinophaga dinghuensis TaxID=1539050 RepID=A0A327VMU3_9BACT|nr:nucleotidyltransferase family protein [Chitinophaga dinghuensis]RAJ76675.1 putative nucleotidyltransferase-like protein [Chitinophaga dinghuensis]